MDKTFLVIDGILIPDMESGSLRIYQRDLGEYIRMINGRLVNEDRGYIWVIEADFEDIDTELLQQIDAAMAAKKNHTIAFLPPNGAKELISSEFYLTSTPTPALKSWMEELPNWSGLAYVFEEIEPHG